MIIIQKFETKEPTASLNNSWSKTGGRNWKEHERVCDERERERLKRMERRITAIFLLLMSFRWVICRDVEDP